MENDTPEIFDPAEDCPWCSPREILARYGYKPLSPDALGDRQLSGRLWELLYAAAARRFFFSDTNHLSDRELYTLLLEQWLDKPTADIPLEAETNTRVMVFEFNHGEMTSEEIWLRYYADEEYRQLILSKELDAKLPPHQDAPYDRDRFLPIPPVPLEAHAGWLPGDDSPSEDDDDDDNPFGESALEEELEASEPDNWTPPAQTLVEENVPLLPPAEITDETLTPILWELLHNLALCGFYCLHTDHLSDRELYAELWERGLRDPAHLPGRNLRGGWYHDFLGSWGNEEMQLWLRYYATEKERAKHAAEYPTDLIPTPEKPQSNRDWRMPKGPF